MHELLGSGPGRDMKRVVDIRFMSTERVTKLFLCHYLKMKKTVVNLPRSGWSAEITSIL